MTTQMLHKLMLFKVINLYFNEFELNTALRICHIVVLVYSLPRNFLSQLYLERSRISANFLEKPRDRNDNKALQLFCAIPFAIMFFI